MNVPRYSGTASTSPACSAGAMTSRLLSSETETSTPASCSIPAYRAAMTLDSPKLKAAIVTWPSCERPPAISSPPATTTAATP